MSLDDFSPLDSPLAERDTVPAELPNVRAPAASHYSDAYRICPRCWLPLAPVRRCKCAPPPDNGAQARLVADYPALQTLADAVGAGRYADDLAVLEDRRRAFAQWLVEHDRLSEWRERDRIDRDE